MARISRTGLVNSFFNRRHFVWSVLSTIGLLLVFSYLLSALKFFLPAPEVSTVAEFFAEFPMRFQSNDGAFAQDVKFFSKGYQYDLLFMNNEVLLNLYSNEQNGEIRAGKSRTKLSQVSLKFLGAEDAPVIKGLGPLQLTKTKTSHSADDAPSGFTEVKYAGVFPGVDVYFHGKQKQLYYEFVLHEQADASQLKLKVYGVDGAGDIEIDLHGNVSVKCRGKKMLIEKPVVYRLVKQKKQVVNGYFFVTRNNEIHFKAVEPVRAT
ncbi:MAG: hypothetical protein L0Z73_19970 [Gammaproteobacteria bacterium]|nr:hypothetical protein [Gammaproteobacteria bacterium]